MIKFLKTALFGYTNTIENIVSSYAKTISDLETHAEEHLKQAVQKAETIAKLAEDKVVHNSEVQKAEAMVAKLKALFA